MYAYVYYENGTGRAISICANNRKEAEEQLRDDLRYYHLVERAKCWPKIFITAWQLTGL